MTRNKFEIPAVLVLSLMIGMLILLLSCGNNIQAAAQVTITGLTASPAVSTPRAAEITLDTRAVSTPSISISSSSPNTPGSQAFELTANIDIEDALLLADSSQPGAFDTNFCKIAEFYGLKYKIIALDTSTLADDQLRDPNGNYYKLIAISARNFFRQPALLSEAELKDIRSAVKKGGVNFYISQLDESMDISMLAPLTDTSISGIKHVSSQTMGWNVSDTPEIAYQFAGQQVTYFSTDSSGYFSIDYDIQSSTSTIINTKNLDGTENPLFIRFTDGSGSIFIDSTPNGINLLDQPFNQTYNNPKYFPVIIPLMFAFRYALGDEIWHSDANYANLTIDDPTLTKNFYELSFSQLLQQMEVHNFHTTIAYRPVLWQQFDIETIKLIEANPVRFSLVQHGNNHDGYEFYKYALGKNDPKNNPDLRARPLAEQEEDIAMGVKRVTEIQKSLNIQIDPVMIFPYGISPEQTLVLLKKYNYLASVSQQEIPLDAAPPAAWDFGMYPAETYYGDFPSVLRRHPGSYLPFKADLQPFLFDLFIGKPALFYSHARDEIFAEGIGGFNPVADQINSLRTPVEWRSLGFILSNLCLEKTEDDGSKSVRMYTRKLTLTNKSEKGLIYHIIKNETLNAPSISITVDGRQYPYLVQDGVLKLDVQLPPNKTTEINITY
ncbi:MAG: hypothetical protein WCP19_02915 [Chloroflexota bacterium]